MLENQMDLIQKMRLIWLGPEICSDLGLMHPDPATLSSLF
jgi:hypothetical protein